MFLYFFSSVESFCSPSPSPFGLYAFRAILPRLEIYLPTVESTTITAILSALGFVILALFFIAIVKKK